MIDVRPDSQVAGRANISVEVDHVAWERKKWNLCTESVLLGGGQYQHKDP